MNRVQRLSELIKARSQTQASVEVFAQATYYPEFVKVYQPNKPMRKLRAGFEPTKKLVQSSATTTSDPKFNLERSIRRTKAKVVAYALCNTYELFATFTFASERQNIDRCKDRLNNWLKNQKKRTSPDLKYLVVPEFHKDGISLHFHALLHGYKGTLQKALDPETGKPRKRNGKIRYNITSYKSGYTDAVKIGSTIEDRQKVGRYISKYIIKEMPIFKNKNRYWVSLGHRLPIIEDNPPLNLLTEPPVWQTSNEYGTISIYAYTEELTEYLNKTRYQSFSGDNLK
jgi:hypothetical protein